MMIDGIPNRPLYFYQKDSIDSHHVGDTSNNDHPKIYYCWVYTVLPPLEIAAPEIGDPIMTSFYMMFNGW